MNLPPLTASITEKLTLHLERVHQKIDLSLQQEADETLNISTLSGIISQAIFYAHLHTPENNQKENIRAAIAKASKHIEHYAVPTEFVDGLAGFGWGVSHIAQMGLLDEDENAFLKELDDFLFQHAQQSLQMRNHDFFYGATGYGKYFLQRRNARPEVDQYLQEIASGLQSIAQSHQGLLLWQTEDDLADNEIDLSLSHGMASMVVFFSRLLENGITTDFSEEVLRNSCDFLIAQKQNSEEGARLPDYVKGPESVIAPLRWCHGDLGIAYALCCADRALGTQAYAPTAKEVVDAVGALRDIKEQHLYSATLCHGTLGVGHFFTKFIDFFGPDPQLQAAIDFWYAESDTMMSSATGYCYFDDDQEDREKTGIIYGIEGTGLALLSALGRSDSSWDSCMHLS
ncbi:MAG: lanthionine synthetase LanC family protein [Salibacteraceae bacterium]